MDLIQSEGIYKNGYGIIPKSVMRDKNLSIEAKAIYSYICSFAGAGASAFPSVKLMLKELNISENRFYKHMKSLTEMGYIKIDRERKGNRLGNNIYTLANNPIRQKNTNFEHISFEGIQNVGIQNEGIHFEGIQNEGTNNNSININSNNNNNNKNNNYYNIRSSSCCDNIFTYFQQRGFVSISSMMAQDINALIEMYSLEEVKQAVDIADNNGKHTLSYVRGILEHRRAGITKAKDNKKELEEWAKSDTNELEGEPF